MNESLPEQGNGIDGQHSLEGTPGLQPSIIGAKAHSDCRGSSSHDLKVVAIPKIVAMSPAIYCHELQLVDNKL
jgi:hypothetical protein